MAATTSFALQVAGSAPVPFPKSPQQVLISVNGVIQEPDPTGSSGFNLVGTNIVFSSAPTNGHAFFGIIYATADYLNAGGNFPAGSLGAPSITFIGDENTGLFRKSGGSVGFVSDATEIANFDSNGITISSGNIIIPDSIIHNGDSNTKIRFPAADTISFETSGSEQLRVDSSGRLLLGVTSDSRTTSMIIQGNSSGASQAQLHMDSATASISSGSNLGIIRFGALGDLRGADIRGQGDGTWNSGSSHPTRLAFFTNNASSAGTPTERMRIDKDGNVGIGTTSPGKPLDVGGEMRANAFIGRTNISAPSEDTSVYRAADNTLAFGTAQTERMRIDASGRLLIGLTTSATTDSNAHQRLQIVTTAGPNVFFGRNDSDTADDSRLGTINFGANHGGTYHEIVTIRAAADAQHASNSKASRLELYTTASGNTQATERMRINKDGNVGIGTTSCLEKLHVNGGDIIISTATAPNFRIVKADNSSGGSANRVFLGYCKW